MDREHAIIVYLYMRTSLVRDLFQHVTYSYKVEPLLSRHIMRVKCHLDGRICNKMSKTEALGM